MESWHHGSDVDDVDYGDAGDEGGDEAFHTCYDACEDHDDDANRDIDDPGADAD